MSRVLRHEMPTSQGFGHSGAMARFESNPILCVEYLQWLPGGKPQKTCIDQTMNMFPFFLQARFITITIALSFCFHAADTE